MIKFLLPLLAILISVTACQSQSGGSGGVLAPQAFQKQLDKMSDATILDVRTPQEYAEGFIAGAKNVNWNGGDFNSQVEGIDKNKPVFVYCLGGGRSAAAAKRLGKLGFKEVYDLQGGMMNWKSNGMPVANTNTAASKAAGMSIDGYNKELEDKRLVLIDFYAPWCAPCKKMAPFLKEIAEEEQKTVKLMKVNADDNELVAQQMKIEALPTLLLYKNGEIVWRYEGYIGKKELLEKISNFK